MYPKRMKNESFVNGPISSALIAGIISACQSNTQLGAHSLFLGQVRGDLKDTPENNAISFRVTKIIYSCYKEMAEKEFERIKQEALSSFNIQRIHIFHSLGQVETGEISMLVIVSSAHRENCFEALKFIVKEIKTKVPIWKKEIYEDGSYRWAE